MVVKEKRHRLPREFYKGTISVVFTLCLEKGVTDVASGFSLSEPKIVNCFTEILTPAINKESCIGPVYPPRQKATGLQTVDECGEGTLRSSKGA